MREPKVRALRCQKYRYRRSVRLCSRTYRNLADVGVARLTDRVGRRGRELAGKRAADGIVDVRFEVEGCKGDDLDGVRLQRVTATGLAVRFAQAA